MLPLEQLTKISLAKRLSILLVLGLLVGVGFWFLYYNPLHEEIEKLKKVNVELVQKRADAERRKKTYDMDRLRRDELKKLYTEQLRALPSETEMSSFINNINSQSEMVGLEILSLRPLKEVAAKYYARIPVSLKLKGTYHQFAKFCYLIGNLDRIINLQDITLAIGKVSESEVILNIDVLATTFRSVEPGAGAGKKGRQK